jgi:hypothetical protein
VSIRELVHVVFGRGRRGFTLVTRVRLYLADGTYAGQLVSEAACWEPGETFVDRMRRQWRVLDVVAAAHGAYRALLVVEPVDGEPAYSSVDA